MSIEAPKDIVDDVREGDKEKVNEEKGKEEGA